MACHPGSNPALGQHEEQAKYQANHTKAEQTYHVTCTEIRAKNARSTER